jgi:hypothetical protein
MQGPLGSCNWHEYDLNTLTRALVPQVPDLGFVDSLVEAEQNPAQTYLYSGTEMPADQEFFNHLMGFEDPQ